LPTSEIIESTKGVLEITREAKDYATICLAINLLAKLDRLLKVRLLVTAIRTGLELLEADVCRNGDSHGFPMK